MNFKMFIEGLEPGTYPGALIIDSDGEIVFRPGEQMVTETVGAVSRTVPMSLYIDESEITNKVHPRFVAGYEAGMADAKREEPQLVTARETVTSDTPAKPYSFEPMRVGDTAALNRQFETAPGSVGIDNTPLVIEQVRFILTHAAEVLIDQNKLSFANAMYRVLAFVNSLDKQLHDLRSHAITDDKFVARSAYEIVKGERDSARQANSMYFSEVNDMKDALHTHLMNVERLEKELAVARKVSMDRAEALNNMTNHDVQQRRIVDAKNTILDAADETSQLQEELTKTQQALIKSEMECNKVAGELSKANAQLSDIRKALSGLLIQPAPGSLLRPATKPPGFA